MFPELNYFSKAKPPLCTIYRRLKMAFLYWFNKEPEAMKALRLIMYVNNIIIMDIKLSTPIRVHETDIIYRE